MPRASVGRTAHERSAGPTRPDDGDDSFLGGTATAASATTPAALQSAAAEYPATTHENHTELELHRQQPWDDRQDQRHRGQNHGRFTIERRQPREERFSTHNAAYRRPAASNYSVPGQPADPLGRGGGRFQLPLRSALGRQRNNSSSTPTPTTPIDQPDTQHVLQQQIFEHLYQQQQQCQLHLPHQHSPQLLQGPRAQRGVHVCGRCGRHVPREVPEDSGMPRSPSHDSLATDLSLLSLSSCGSEVSRIGHCGSSCFASQSCTGGGLTQAPTQGTTTTCCHHHASSGPHRISVGMAADQPPSAGGDTDLTVGSPVGLDDCNTTPLIQVHDATLPSSSTSGQICSGHGELTADYCGLHNRCTTRSSLLQVPTESYGGSRVHEPCTLFEEESEAIRNCSLLSSAVLGGLMKSFSTGDISHVLELDPPDPLRSTVSEELITENARNVTPWNNLEVPVNRRLDCASRSCSTWVAVGDMHSAQSTSQLPSPSARCGSGNIPGFTAADLVRSVNKKARQMYIRRRLLSTYKALERLTKSQLNLSEALQATGPQDLRKNLQDELRLTSSTSVEAGRTDGRKTPLTTRDVERDRGKPLTKYERNMMIFNWLHNLDDDDDSVTPPFDLPPGSNGGSQQQVQQAA